jgi:hypothetical protein
MSSSIPTKPLRVPPNICLWQSENGVTRVAVIALVTLLFGPSEPRH